MSRFLRAILLSAYTAIFIQLFKILTMDRTEEIVTLNYRLRTPGTLKKLNRELKKYGRNISIINYSFKPPVRLPTDLKYILKYTDAFAHYTSSTFHNGQRAFIDANCTHNNCFLTNDKSLLIDTRNFDAVLFDVENTWDAHPVLRSVHQKYIFTASESSDNYPVCHPIFDSYYNWTWSYRLDSDIRWTFFSIYDKNGAIVGPKIDMKWIDPMSPVTDEIKKKLATKTKAVAWFVSNCFSKSGRENVTRNLQIELAKYGHGIDIYGWCGNLVCSRDRIEYCEEILEKDYYFYLAFENSICVDYVTEKILFPTKHYAVPIVFGGADYSRFLPPNSYLNAGILNAKILARKIDNAIKNKEELYKYFRWHNHYEYRPAAEVSDICTLCEMLNKHQDYSVVKNFRHWWNANYSKICDHEYNETIFLKF